jgi:septal ring factor EnvC (AmiA/AmiB activator)
MQRFLFPFILCLASISQADVESDLAKTRQQLQVLEQQVNAARKSRSTEEQSLAETELEISALRKSLGELEQAIAQQDDRVNQLASAVERNRAELSTEREHIEQIIVQLYKQGQGAIFEALLSGDSPGEVQRQLKYLQSINEAQKNKIQDYLDLIDNLESAELELSDEQAQLAKQLEQEQQQLSDLERAKVARQQVLAKLDQQISSVETRLQQATMEEQRLLALLEEVQKKLSALPAQLDDVAFSQMKQKLPWPVEGKIVQSYGAQLGNSGIRSSGWVLSADAGKEVVAVHHGRVGYAGWLKGYGLLLVLDHGDGYLSLYGRNENLAVNLGDWVNAGDVISWVGDTGGHDDTGLYFELRKQRSALNPASWLRKQ